MKAICDFCKHQKQGPNGRGVGCGKAYIHTDEEGYGQFKHGAQCVYDSDLSDLFEQRTGAEISVRNMAETIERQNEDLMRARDKITRLEARLVDVGV
jgi:hypothetical protein